MSLASAMAMRFDIFGNDKTASKALSSVGSKADQTGGKLSGMGKMGKAGGLLLAGGVGAAAAGVAGLAAAGMKSIKSAEGARVADAKLARVLKEMGYEKNAAAASKYADKLERVIGVDADEIKGAQAKLGTFSDLAKSQDLMARTTKVAADMSAAGFGDMGSASVGLGKALQDPIAGMSLLSKAGSLTKAEQKQIGDEFKRTGDKGAAQEAILAALEKQVGGVAEASSTSSSKMGLAFGEISESIGGMLLPAFDKMTPVIFKAIDWFTGNLIPAVQKFGKQMMPLLSAAMDKVRSAFEDAKPGLQVIWDGLKGLATVIATKVAPVVIKLYSTYLSGLLKGLGKVGEFLPTMASGFLRFASTGVKAFKGLYTAVTGVMEGILTVAEKTMGWIPGIGDKIKKAKAGFATFRDDTIGKLDDVAKGLESAAKKVDAYGEKAKKVKRAKLEADITDLSDKLATARKKVMDPDISKTRKAKLTANIKDMEDKLATAKRKLGEIKDKTVTINVALKWAPGKGKVWNPQLGAWVPKGKARGGLITGPGTGTSDTAGTYRLSNGEFVMRASAVSRLGVRYLDRLNSGEDQSVVVARSAMRGSGGTVSLGSGGPDLHVHFDNPIIGSKEDLARYITDAQIAYGRAKGTPLFAGRA